jgi:hypothetical protein
MLGHVPAEVAENDDQDVGGYEVVTEDPCAGYDGPGPESDDEPPFKPCSGV